MKFHLEILFTLAALGISVGDASSAAIEERHRACAAATECMLITVGCACIHNASCASAEDLQQGTLAVVNKKFAQQFSHLAECSKADVSHCAAAGACPLRGTWVPVCKDQKCSALFKSNR